MPKTVAQDLRKWAAIDENGTRADDLRRIANVCDAQTAALEAMLADHEGCSDWGRYAGDDKARAAIAKAKGAL